MDAALQVGSHESGVKVENHISQSVGHASCDAPQIRFTYIVIISKKMFIILYFHVIFH